MQLSFECFNELPFNPIMPQRFSYSLSRSTSTVGGFGGEFAPLRRSASAVNTSATHILSERNARKFAERPVYNRRPDLGPSIISSTPSFTHSHYSQRERPIQSYLDDTLSLYQTQLVMSPYYSHSAYNTRLSTVYIPPTYGLSKSSVAQRSYVASLIPPRRQNQFTTSKAWMSPTYWQNKRDREWHHSMDLSSKGYGYYNYKRHF